MHKRIIATVVGGLLLAAVGISQAATSSYRCTIVQCGTILHCPGKGDVISNWIVSGPCALKSPRVWMPIVGGYSEAELLKRCQQMITDAGVCTAN